MERSLGQRALAFAREVEPPFGSGGRGMASRLLTLAAFAIGAFASFLFLYTSLKLPAQLFATALSTMLYAVARAPLASRVGRLVRGLAIAGSVAVHVLWLYAALVFGTQLAWTLPRSVVALVAVFTIGVLVTSLSRVRGPQVPLALPLGVLIAGSLSGWVREEWWLRCDDLLAALRQPGVTLVMPTSAAAEQCASGRGIALGHYPRKIWESDDGARLVFTTQAANTERFRPSLVVDSLPGAACEAWIDRRSSPRCVGPIGKSHALVDGQPLDRLFVGVMSGYGERTGGVLALSRSEPLRELEHVPLRQAGAMYFDAKHDVLINWGDEGRVMTPVRASRLEVLPAAPSSLLGPDSAWFDPASERGVLCGAFGPLRTIDGRAAMALAVSGYPPTYRQLAPSGRYPSSWLALSWGCDWDGRKVWAAIATLGMLATIDFESGEILERRFVGFGVRTVIHERKRDRLYLGSFLSGEVRAIEASTGREVGRWFAGRFVRDIVPTHDGRAILVSSNLGIVRIELGGSG